MPQTPLGWLSYDEEGSTSWYTDGDNEGLESWLATVELMGIPTYATAGDLPSAGTTGTKDNGTDTQRQFAAVIADATIYRDDGTDWVAWAFGANASPTWNEKHTFISGLNTPEISGGVVNRSQPVTSISGNVFVAEEGTDPSTVLQENGDVVFLYGSSS